MYMPTRTMMWKWWRGEMVPSFADIMHIKVPQISSETFLMEI